MKITDIQIGHYGVWKHLALAFAECRAECVLRTERSRQNHAAAVHSRCAVWPAIWELGTPSREHRRPRLGGFAEVFRGRAVLRSPPLVPAEGAGDVELQELDPHLAWNTEPDWALADSQNFDGPACEGPAAEAALQALLSHADARLFRHVFAIGLSELQVLATLHDEEVAREIYGLSLGIEGRKLLKVSAGTRIAAAVSLQCKSNRSRNGSNAMRS